jgi:copper chaperone CopZ
MENIFLKKIAFIAVLFIIVSLYISCGKKNEISDSHKNDNKQNMNNEMQVSNDANTEHTMIKLPTMQCKICKKNIENAVKKVPGVISVNVDVEDKIAHINYDKSKTDLSKIELAITMAGYDANDKKADPSAYENLDDCCKLPKDRKEN